MPGLKQLKQLNTDMLNFGDEVRLRSTRGEKPVTVPIPKDITIEDDSEDFKNGMPELSEEEQLQADAAEREREREANDFSDIMGGGEESEDGEKTAAKTSAQPDVPDMSDLLAPSEGFDLGDIDLSDFETPEPEPEPEPPKEIPIEDLDLEALLAPKNPVQELEPEPEPIPETVPEPPKPRPTRPSAEEPISSYMDKTDPLSMFAHEPKKDEPGAPDMSVLLGKDAVDSALFPDEDILELVDNIEVEEPTAKKDFELSPIDESEVSELAPIEDISSMDKAVSPEEVLGSSDDFEGFGSTLDAALANGGAEIPFAEPADDFAGFDADIDSLSTADDSLEGEPLSSGEDSFSMDDFSADFDSLSTEPESPAVSTPDFDSDIDTLSAADDSLGGEPLSSGEDSFSMDDFGADIDSLTAEPEAPEPEALEEPEPAPSKDKEVFDTFDLPDFGVQGIEVEDYTPPPSPEEKSSPESSGSDDLGIEGFSVEDYTPPPSPEEKSTPESSGSDDLGIEGFSVEDYTPPPAAPDVSAAFAPKDNTFDIPDFGDDMGGFGMDIGSVPDAGGLGGAFDAPEADMSVPDEPLEMFDTSGMDGVDFELGGADVSSDDDFFNIPGFSDTTTANLNKPNVQTPDFAGAIPGGKPKNTFTEAEYKRFQKNLATYPLNVRIALEDLVVKNEFTDDAVFGILEKVLRKVPARQLATELEKMLDIQLDVPRDFERRSATEYEAYKKSIEYQLKNKIIPGAILTTLATIIIVFLFVMVKNFIYEPLVANSLYKQGYALLQENQYPQSEDRFNRALEHRQVKKWFYTYAEGYRDHKQYDRARMMYRAVLSRYKHEKPAGMAWADMEMNDLYNYEESERILKREVLDYHINDPDAILKLGDLYLEWATERDPEKFKDAKYQYDLLLQLYNGNRDTNTYLSRQMRYYIRTDNLRQVLEYKKIFYPQKKALGAEDLTDLSGYLLDKRYGQLRPSEESLRSSIENVRELLERALKADPTNPVALYNMGRYFAEANNSRGAKSYLKNSIDRFSQQDRRNRRDTYRYINAHRMLGEEYRDEREYLLAEETYGEGISLFEKENSSSGFESDTNVGKLYADIADIDYFISGDDDHALTNYINAVNNKFDTSSVRYRIGFIQYNKGNYPEALGSFIRSQDSSGNDTHLLLALANTLVQNSDNYVAKGYYERLLALLDSERERYGVLFPQVRDDQADIVDTYMKASNNLGVTLSRLATMTGQSSYSTQAIVHLQESIRAWDALTRNQETMIRLEGSNLAEQNVKYLTRPSSSYEPAIYTEIPRTLTGEEGLE